MRLSGGGYRQTMGKGYKKESVLLKDNTANPVVVDSVTLLRDAGFNEDYISQFADDAVGVLNDYADLIGEGVRVEYSLRKRLAKFSLIVKIPGDRYDPFVSGSSAKRRRLESVLSLNLNTEMATVSHDYAFGNNIISVSVPLSERRKALYKDPMVLSIVLGVVLGLLCQHIPEAANSFLVNELASPLLSIMLDVLSGIMGPVIFISMTTSIIALESINDLTNLGFKIMKRFLVTILFLIAVSIVVSSFFFRSVGTGSISFAPDQLMQMILDIIPTNLFKPFVENNTPQLVLLGVLLGSALLILGDSVNELNEMLLQINEWMMSAMKIVLMAIPAVPFLSIFTSVAKGSGAEILEGWKFIVASYIAYTICTVVKAVKTSVKTGVSIPELWRKIKPVASMGFTTCSTAAPMKLAYEVSEKELHIKPEFTSFWIPMASAMLSPKTTINVVIATFMVAEMTGIAVDNSFILALILVTLELSVASPGTTGAWAIMFKTLSMPTSYVGYFTVYRILTNNYTNGCAEAYYMLEEFEAAHKLGGIDEQKAMKNSHDQPADDII